MNRLMNFVHRRFSKILKMPIRRGPNPRTLTDFSEIPLGVDEAIFSGLFTQAQAMCAKSRWFILYCQWSERPRLLSLDDERLIGMIWQDLTIFAVTLSCGLAFLTEPLWKCEQTQELTAYISHTDSKASLSRVIFHSINSPLGSDLARHPTGTIFLPVPSSPPLHSTTTHPNVYSLPFYSPALHAFPNTEWKEVCKLSIIAAH